MGLLRWRRSWVSGRAFWLYVMLTGCRKSRSVSHGECCCLHVPRMKCFVCFKTHVKCWQLAWQAPLPFLSFGYTQNGHTCGECCRCQDGRQESRAPREFGEIRQRFRIEILWHMGFPRHRVWLEFLFLHVPLTQYFSTVSVITPFHSCAKGSGFERP